MRITYREQVAAALEIAVLDFDNMEQSVGDLAELLGEPQPSTLESVKDLATSTVDALIERQSVKVQALASFFRQQAQRTAEGN